MTGIEVQEDYLKDETERREVKWKMVEKGAAERIILMVGLRERMIDAVSGHIETALKTVLSTVIQPDISKLH
jgi:hypothetical protein